MNKKIALVGLPALACVLSMSSCTTVGEHKSSAELYYTNYTKADTQEYEFLREVYQLANDEINFADVIAKRGANTQVKALATNLSSEYKGIQTKLAEIGKNSDVLIPFAGVAPLALSEGLDSAQANVLEKAFLEKSIHNQEVIIEHFEQASRNTAVEVRHYAEETLPKLEEQLEKTKGLL
ncbi:hypothetical protein GCM10023231_16140 [Olivibacter ginsenosidimutans]|uniref:DUF4142 domain-containing protein n=1 Tax=Olivibacter ginsenosidimutans TaxID=1176537 RepID=A0ABP9B1L7_9SPHI